MLSVLMTTGNGQASYASVMLRTCSLDVDDDVNPKPKFQTIAH